MPYRDRETQRQYQREYLAAKRAAYLNGKYCVECGSTQRLEIDHIDPTQKITHAFWSWSEERRLVELAKCQILCYDCHKKKTIMQTLRKNVPHGTITMYRRGCHCNECKGAKARDTAAYRKRTGHR